MGNDVGTEDVLVCCMSRKNILRLKGADYLGRYQDKRQHLRCPIDGKFFQFSTFTSFFSCAFLLSLYTQNKLNA